MTGGHSLQSLLIQDNKAFMQHLLVAGTFDAFELVSAQLATFCTFSVAGDYIPGFLPQEDALPAAASAGPADVPDAAANKAPASHTYTPWRLIRPHMLDLIRGKSKPSSMRIVLRMSNENTQKVLRSSGADLNAGDVTGLYLNITYQYTRQEETITCIPGVSIRVFTLDKRLEHTWDEMVGKFLKQSRIPFLNA